MAAILGVGRGDSIMCSKGIINLLVLAIAVLSLNFRYQVVVEGARSLSEEEDLELERQLKILNKPPIKTIHTEWGDIIDCIDIYKQPAFDNPLLKNHKIQMKPSSIPKSAGDETSSTTKPKPSSLRALDDECPKGTVPIRRTRKEDLIRAKSSSPKAIFGASNNTFSGQYVSLLYQVTGEAYYGASATINLYNPDSVRQDQFSSAELMVASGPHEQMNAIYSGWMVQPQLYCDNVTRLFAFWTGNGSKSGCYNTLCPGFVQVDQRYTPSAPLTNTSTYEGPQFTVDVKVYQDRQKGDWWLVYERNIYVGYWPNSLFPLFVAGGSYLYWGGHVQAGGDGVTPRMGSGHFPDGDYHHSCYFNRIQYVDGSNSTVDPNEDKIVKINQCETWHRVKYYGYQRDEQRHTFQFGGPGGQCA
ncbi:protein of unknown function DUF239 [Macleaya cordata]|uniref:Neprosin PEP catalytic domain-containing protein n=1 Tax=Macleaya cordata TaxID=56857 RepID=A0A200PSS4_MACCD|nr:protein of unknown function DUF239 [Macleaya cordata]